MTGATTDPEPKCECGYRCVGATLADRILDGQRHAHDVHGIDVTPQQVQAASRVEPTSPS